MKTMTKILKYIVCGFLFINFLSTNQIMAVSIFDGDENVEVQNQRMRDFLQKAKRPSRTLNLS